MGDLSQMWVGGVADSQTRSKPLKTPSKPWGGWGGKQIWERSPQKTFFSPSLKLQDYRKIVLEGYMIFLSKSPYIFLEIMSSLKLLSKLAYFFTGMGLWHTTGARHVNIQLVFAHFFREKIFLERFYLDLKYLSLEFK